MYKEQRGGGSTQHPFSIECVRSSSFRITLGDVYRLVFGILLKRPGSYKSTLVSTFAKCGLMETWFIDVISDAFHTVLWDCKDTPLLL